MKTAIKLLRNWLRLLLEAVVTVDEIGQASARILRVSHYPESELVDFDRFNAGLQEWGISWNGHANDRQYGEDAHWDVLFETWIPAGLKMIINDTPAGDQSFYRLSVKP